MTVQAFYRMPAVQERVGGVSRVTIYEWIKKGQFPKPVKIGGRAVAWRASDLSKWADDPQAWREQNEVA